MVAGSVSLQGASEGRMNKTIRVKPKVEHRFQEVRFQEPVTSDGNRRQGAEPIQEVGSQKGSSGWAAKALRDAYHPAM